MAVTINIPSQVKTYANLAAFPASGSLKTIYIAEDTNKTYRWTGSVYVEISASAAMTWGQIGGTLSNQTDLQNALDAKVPTSRTLTINGVAQDLSADRSWTISTGLTVGTTPIASGTIGRVLFQGTGNVLQQSSSLFWDSTNNRLGIGTSSPLSQLQISNHGLNSSTFFTGGVVPGIQFQNQATNQRSMLGIVPNGSSVYADLWLFSTSDTTTNFSALAYGYESALSNQIGTWAFNSIKGGTGVLHAMYFNATGNSSAATSNLYLHTSGNVGINTTTDAGFRLDVNGTARVQGNAQFGTGFYWDNTNGRLGIGGTPGAFNLDVVGSARTLGTSQIRSSSGSVLGSNLTTTAAAIFYNNGFSGVVGVGSYANSGGEIQSAQNGGLSVGGFLTLQRQGGNVLIGTATDAGFKLDVNGTARVQGQFDVISGTANFRVNNSSSFVQLGIGATSWVAYNATESYFSGTQFYFNSGANFRFAGVGQFGFTTNPNASAQVQIDSTTKGFLPPRMTTTQRNAIATPAAGLVVYDTTLAKLCVYTTTWETITSL